MTTTRTATIHVRPFKEAMATARKEAISAWTTGRYQGEHFGFESAAVLFRRITPKRWEMLECLQRTGPLTIRALARELDRQFRRVHDDVTALLQIGLIEKTADGKVWVPFNEIRIDSVLRSAAA